MRLVDELSAAAIEQIIERVFVERGETLDAAAQLYDIHEFRITIVRQRESMAVTTAALPDAAFRFRGGTSADEADWSAEQLLDRLQRGP